MTASDDALRTLAKRTDEGDEEAAEALVTHVRPVIVRYCTARLGPVPGLQHTVEDVVQEVCLGMLSGLPRYRDTGRPFIAFVLGIAAHKVVDAQRRTGRTVPFEDLPDRADESPGPEDHAVRASQAEEARVLLDSLPDVQRELILLRVGVGLTAQETGEVLNMSAGSVRVVQHRALSRLRSMSIGGSTA
ncbi:MAG: RNA polymerase sigma factor ShbA [Streptosporangiaceae bacterium]